MATVVVQNIIANVASRCDMSIEKAVVEQISKRVNVSTGLAHPLDESAAKELLKEMYARGYSFDSAEIISQAIANNWSSSDAKDLANVAEKISSGKRVVIKHKNCWNPDVFDEVESNT
ncbi:DUF1889 family protein [Vibrio cholerae]